MRKHFLILMLLALLPLASFAAPFSVGGEVVYAIRAIANGDLVYNKSDYSQTVWQIQYQLEPNGSWNNLNSGYTLSYYATQNAVNPIPTNADPATPITEAGDYWIGLSGTTTEVVGDLDASKRFKFTIAQAPLNITVNNGQKDYGDDFPAWTWEVADGTQFAPGDSKMNVAVNIVATPQQGDNLDWGGEHTFASVTATEATGNYAVTVTNAATLKLNVKKAKLVIAVGPAYGQANYLFTKKYYELEDALTVDYDPGVVTASGQRGTDNPALVLPTSGKISYTYNLAGHRDADANADTNGNLFSTAANANTDYEITFSGITLGETDARNYDIVYEKRIVCIKQIEITTGGQNNPFTFTKGNINFTYTGAKQEPTAHKITYKWGTGNNDKIELVKGQDYDFSYILSSEPADPIQATDDPTTDNVEAKYAVKVVKATGTGSKKNFIVDNSGIAIADFDFPIKKKELTILVNPQSKEYIGQAAAPTFTPAFTINGFVAADASKTVTGLGVEPVLVYNAQEQPVNPNPNELSANVGKYYQQVATSNQSKLTWTEGQTQKEELITKNYYINKLTAGYFEITPKTLTVTLTDDKTITFGETLPVEATLSANTDYAAMVTISGNIQNELNGIKGNLSLGLKKQSTTGENPQPIPNNEYYNEAKTYDDCWVITYDADAQTGRPTGEYLKNYTIASASVLAKDFIMGKAGFTMMAVGTQKEYDAQAATAANLSYIAYAGAKTVTIPSTVTVAYEFQKGNGWTDEFPTSVGTYTYRVKANEAYAPADYDGKKIQYPTATFEITKKVVKVKVSELTLHVGDDAAILNKYAKVTMPTAGKQTLGNDKLSLVYSFTNAVTGSATYWNANKLAQETDANGIAAAITVRLANATDDPGVDLLQNGNYTLEALDAADLGKLIISGRAISTFDLAEGTNYVNQLVAATTATDAEHTIDVRFKNTLYTIPAGQWRTLVLPFDITPLDFCNMVGVNQYAIFNKLTSADATTNVVRFSLEQQLLPANTPFLVKAPKDIVLDGVEFANRNIEYVETPTSTVSQAKFIGSYVDVNGIEGGSNKMWWKNSVGNFVVATDGGVAVAFPNYAFHAYLELDPNFNASEARIFVQEADGSTTAINAVTGEQQNFAKGAWYTINGMKVNGVPTEKGIYIQNGKKVVIK